MRLIYKTVAGYRAALYIGIQWAQVITVAAQHSRKHRQLHPTPHYN